MNPPPSSSISTNTLSSSAADSLIFVLPLRPNLAHASLNSSRSIRPSWSTSISSKTSDMLTKKTAKCNSWWNSARAITPSLFVSAATKARRKDGLWCRCRAYLTIPVSNSAILIRPFPFAMESNKRPRSCALGMVHFAPEPSVPRVARAAA